MDPVSCVSCVSWMHWMNAAETHETFRQESGMRYQIMRQPESKHGSGLFAAYGIRRTPISYPHLHWQTTIDQIGEERQFALRQYDRNRPSGE